MESIDCGSVNVALEIGNDGIGVAHFSGLLLPGNIRKVNEMTLGVGAGCGAKGLLYRGDRAVVCCDAPSMSVTYPSLTPGERRVPVAFVVNAAQAALHERLVQRAGAAGVLRRMFYSEAEAHAWLRQTARLLRDNNRWWAHVRPIAQGLDQAQGL